MSSESLPENTIDLSRAHAQIVSEQIEQLESRVKQMESTLIDQATRLHHAVTERLDSLCDYEKIVQFTPFDELGDGYVKVAPPTETGETTGHSLEFYATVKATREQLQLLNQTIENIQLAR